MRTATTARDIQAAHDRLLARDVDEYYGEPEFAVGMEVETRDGTAGKIVDMHSEYDDGGSILMVEIETPARFGLGWAVCSEVITAEYTNIYKEL